MTRNDSRLDWFRTARFGLFVHYGPYSLAARHEWVMNYEEMPVADYERYARHFDPDLFDAPALARAAREAGAQYVVLTTKHHDGYGLWDSRVSDYTAFATVGRDLVEEFVTAMRAEGLRVGLYHSLLDWHHPDYTIDRHHPRRGDADWQEQNATKDFSRYREYLHAQVRELLTGYGQIDYLFFDFTEPAVENGLPGKSADDWHGAELLALCRELQPDMIVNDRLGVPADLVTPEQYQPTEALTLDGRPVAWEACQTLNGSWGYHRDNLDYKSPELLVGMLAGAVANDGNLLLNIGPTGRGEIAPRDAATLESVGEWVRRHERAIRGAGASTFTPPSGALYTQRGDRLYLHMQVWPFGMLHLPELAGKVELARFVHDGSEVRFTEIDEAQEAITMTPAGTPPGTLTLLLPAQRPDVATPVIELILTSAP